jgi:Na+/proline symporter
LLGGTHEGGYRDTVGVGALDWASLLVYLLLMVAIAAFFSRSIKGAKDFLAGGRRIPWWVAGTSLYMGLFSAWTFSGAASLVYRTGWYGMAYFATWPIGFFIGFMLAAVRCRRSRVISPIEYVETRFNSATHTTLSVLFAASLLYWPIQHMASLGKIVGPMLVPNSEVAIILTILVIATLVLFYTFSGGLWAVAVTDAVQSFLLIGVVVILIGMIIIETPELFRGLPPFTIRPPADEASYDSSFLLAYIMQVAFSAGMGDRAQRYYSVRDERAVLKLGLLTTALFAVGPLFFGLIPFLGTVVWPDAAMIPGFAGLKNPQEGVYVAMAAKYLPPGILGMFLAAMLAATMSATDTCWNTASAIVSVDLYKRMFRPKADDRQVLNVGRVAIVFFFMVAVAGALAVTTAGVKLDIIGLTIGLLTGVAVSIPLTLGLVVRKVSRWAAVGSVAIGSLAAVVSSDLSIFGPLRVIGFLKYPFGYRVFFIVGVTLAVFLLSRAIGRLGRSRRAAVLLSGAVAVGSWFFFLFLNTNAALSWDLVFGNAGAPAGSGSPRDYFVAMCVGAAAFGYLMYVFARLYGRDVDAPEPEVDRFFKLLKTPIDAEKEVGDEQQTVSAYHFVGMIVLLLAGMSLALLLFPAGRGAPGVNLVLAALLVLIGLGIMRGGKGLQRRMKKAAIVPEEDR